MSEELKPGDVSLADLITMIDMVENHTDAIDLADKLWPMIQARPPAQQRPENPVIGELIERGRAFLCAPAAGGMPEDPFGLVEDLTSAMESLRGRHAEIAPAKDLRERIAIALWHRFAPEHHMEWSEEQHSAEYLDAADAVLILTRRRSPAVKDDDQLPDRTVAQWFLDNHQDIDLKHLDALTDLVRRARNDTRLPTYVERRLQPVNDSGAFTKRLNEANVEIERLRAQVEEGKSRVKEACDLLAERTYGNAARSPGHNARLRLEGWSALTSTDGDRA